MNKNNGGPAFPTLHIPDCSPPAWNGMDLHDYFAAKAMQAIIGKWGTINHKSIAEVAYELADAMLEQREKWGDSVVKESLTAAPKECPMNNDLLKRIDESFFFVVDADGQQRLDKLLADCRAEIERKATYVPMTQPELYRIWSINSSLLSLQDEFIKRAGLNMFTKHENIDTSGGYVDGLEIKHD